MAWELRTVIIMRLEKDKRFQTSTLETIIKGEISNKPPNLIPTTNEVSELHPHKLLKQKNNFKNIKSFKVMGDQQTGPTMTIQVHQNILIRSEAKDL